MMFKGQWLAAALVVASAGTHASAAVLDTYTYTYSPTSGSAFAPDINDYPDASGTELNDDALGTATFADPAWVGTIGSGSTLAKPQVNIDFGGLRSFDDLTVTYMVAAGSSIDPIASARVIISNDNVFDETPLIFSAEFTTNTPSPTVGQAVLDLNGALGRYVQVSFHSPSDLNSWVFLSELDFTGEVPEPASLALLAIGGVTLLSRRRTAK